MPRGEPKIGQYHKMPDGRSFEIEGPAEITEAQIVVPDPGDGGPAAVKAKTPSVVVSVVELAAEKSGELAKVEREPFNEIRAIMRPALKAAQEILPGLLALQAEVDNALLAAMSIDEGRLRAYPSVSPRTVDLFKRTASDAYSLLSSAVRTLSDAKVRAQEIELRSHDQSSPVSGRALANGFVASVEQTRDVEPAVRGAIKNLETYGEALAHQLRQASAPVKLISLVRTEAPKRQTVTPQVVGFEGQVTQEAQ